MKCVILPIGTSVSLADRDEKVVNGIQYSIVLNSNEVIVMVNSERTHV